MEIDNVFASGAVVGRATKHLWGHLAACGATGDPTRAWWRVQPRLRMQKRGQFLQQDHQYLFDWTDILFSHPKTL